MPISKKAEKQVVEQIEIWCINKKVNLGDFLYLVKTLGMIPANDSYAKTIQGLRTALEQRIRQNGE